MLLDDVPFGSILLMNFKEGSLLVIPTKNVISMCFADVHTTLTTYLFLELCLHSRLCFVYLSAN